MVNNNITTLVPYVLQKHNALSAGLHYDLRLMYPYNKLLASWALPKARIPITTKERYLAIKTMDHDERWLRMEGFIKEGKYGHGTVKILDKGFAKIHNWSKYLITFEIHSKYFDGKYTLIRTSNAKVGLINKKIKQESWWLIKNKEKLSINA